MASPHMAGVMALLKQTHPTWSVEQLKALAMNTAGQRPLRPFGQTGDKYNPGRVGSGRVQVPSALASSSIAYNADGSGSVSVSFGDVEVAGTYYAQRTIRVENHGASAQTYALGYDARSSIPGVSYSFPGGSSLSVPAGGSATFVVQLDANADRDAEHPRRHRCRRPGRRTPRQWLSEASGLVTVTPSSGSALRVPVYAAARPASTTKAAPKFLNVGKGTSATINIAGEGVNTGAEPLGYLSKVSAFELGITSGKATLGTGVSELARGADVQYAGAAVKGNTVYFGVSTHARLGDSGDGRAVQRPGRPRRQRHGRLHGVHDALHVRAERRPAGRVRRRAAERRQRRSLHERVQLEREHGAVQQQRPRRSRCPSHRSGCRRARRRSSTGSVGFSRFWGTIDTTDWATYNVATPGLTFSDGLAGTTMYPALDGQKIDVGYNDAVFTANGSKGVLLLHHFNTSGHRAEVVEIKK